MVVMGMIFAGFADHGCRCTQWIVVTKMDDEVDSFTLWQRAFSIKQHQVQTAGFKFDLAVGRNLQLAHREHPGNVLFDNGAVDLGAVKVRAAD